MKVGIFFFFIYSVILMICEGALNPFKAVKCAFYECCQPPYIRQNFTKLEINLNKYLYGQPLVKNTLLHALKGHFEISNPKKSLVLSFHGSSGVGKNFVSQFVAESLFERGVKSKFYKHFTGTKDFPHVDETKEYKNRVKKVVEETVKECQYSLFVFDETDKIPLGVIDTVRSYIDYNQELDGIDYRKAIFIFLSNSASKVITDMTAKFDNANLARESFNLKQFQKAIQDHVYFFKETEEKRGMQYASIIDSHLIDYYVPFLPLEKKHVRKCIETEFDKYQLDQQANSRKNLLDDVDSVLDQLVFEPQNTQKFSVCGCKRVPMLVRTLIAENSYILKNEL